MKRIIFSASAPKAIGPYSQAVMAGDTLYASGQIPINPLNGQLVGETIEEQAHQVFKNIKGVLDAAGLELTNVVKTTVMLDDINNFKTVNEIYAQYFIEQFPARSTFQVVKLPMGSKIEIEFIAYKGKL